MGTPLCNFYHMLGLGISLETEITELLLNLDSLDVSILYFKISLFTN